MKKKLSKYPKGGTTGEDFAYDRWRRSLPENLQSESPSYNLRGYWESLGKPEKFEPFNYDLYGGEYDGPNGEFLYHGFSRNPETGEILKGKTHPTLNMALNDKDAEGNVYLPYMKDGKIFTKKYGKGGTFLTAGNEYHRIYKNADGDIMVNHPKEDKGKWDTINLTDKTGAKTVADGVAATKKWHRENPYGYGGSIFNYPDGGLINNTMKKRTLSKTVYKYGGKLPQHGTGATVGKNVGMTQGLDALVPGLGVGVGVLGTMDQMTQDANGNPKSGFAGNLNRANPLSNMQRIMEGKDVGRSLLGLTGVGTVAEMTGLSDSIFGSSDYDSPEEMARKQQQKQETFNKIKYGPKQENPYVDITQKSFNFPYGGVIDQHMANPNAELELEETFQTPDGTVGRVDGPSHDNGGIEVNLPEGTKIFSDRLKYKNGRTYAQITKPITTKIAKLEKKLQDNPQDVASANTVYLLNQQLDHYFDDQETNKSMKEIKRTLKMANGGMIKRANFARSAAKWKHEHGGLIHYPNGGPVLGQINPRTGKAFSRDEVSTYYDFADMLPTPFGMEYGGLDSQGNQRFGNYNQLSLPSPVNPQETISPRLPQRPQPGVFAAPSPVNAQLPYTSVAPDVTVPFTPENPVFGFTDRTDLFPKQPAQITMQPSTTPPVTAGQTLTPDKEVTFTTGTTSTTPTTPTTKPESWASKNMGTLGQVGAGLTGAALRAYNLSKIKAPGKLASLDFSSSMYNPDLVDYSANINAANRSAISAMDEAQRGFGSSATAQAFKNKARLNQLETTGKIYQGQENVNKQLLNEARQRNQQIRMQEQAANQEIAKQNMENAYNYEMWKQQQKNQIVQDLMGTAGDVFGGMQKFRNQKDIANILSRSREKTVNKDVTGGTDFETEVHAFGGMIREFKDGGIHIKPENRGKFTATKKRTGKSTEELTHSKNPLTRKRAIFAQNAKKWAKK